MKRRGIKPMAIIVGITVIFVLSIVAIQVYQSKFGQNIFTTSGETAISIVIKKNNLTNHNIDDYAYRYVHIKGNGSVYESDPTTNNIGRPIGLAEPTITGGNYFGWEIKSKRDNKTYYLDNNSEEIISKSN